MKQKHILIFLMLFYSIINQEQNVINGCGNNKFKNSYEMPKIKEDCKDGEFCRLVQIIKDEKNYSFCAEIHGKFNDGEIWEDFRKIINASYVSVSESKYFKSVNVIILNIFFYILLFLL